MSHEQTELGVEVTAVGDAKPNATVDVIFVHGIGGDPVTTWTGGLTAADAFWPAWVDAALPEAQVWTARYPAQITSWFGPSFPLMQSSISLLDRLTQKLGAHRIIFVCHSLGGLIVKQILRAALDSPARPEFRQLGELISGVVFLGTPHQGAFLAGFATSLVRVMGRIGRMSGFTPTAAELAKQNPYLENLGDWFRSEVTARKINVAVYSETLPTQGLMIVDHHSANPGLVNVQSIPMALDHYGLAGPRQKGDQISEGVVKFVRSLAADSSPSFAPASAGIIAMEVGLGSNEPQELPQSPDGVLRYTMQRSASGVSVGYQLEYLEKFRSGGPISPKNYLGPTRCPFLWSFPALDLKFVNNTNQTVYLSEIVLEVDESQPIREPLFAIRRDVQQRHAGHVLLVNEGWTEITDLALHFDITPGLVTDSVSMSPPYKHSISAGPLIDSLEIDISDAFGAEEGLDLHDLLRIENGDWTEDGQFQLPEVDGKRELLTQEEVESRQEKALGPFKDWVATVAGEVSYSVADAPGEQRAVKFQTFVYLANANRFGVPRPPSFEYQVTLETDARSYTKIVSISQELKAGDTDRFTLKVAAPQSSSHRFSIKVRDISGQELPSPPIDLHCFVPRSLRTRLRLGQ